MKAKLLKKIRRQYSIIHYPKGMLSYNQIRRHNKFIILKNGSYFNTSEYDSKQEALDVLLETLKIKYAKYSIHSDYNFFKPVKVWP